MTATATKERPILFSGEMVRAILDGRKTMTRRVVSKGNSEFGSAKRDYWDHADFDAPHPGTLIETPWTSVNGSRLGGYLHVPCHSQSESYYTVTKHVPCKYCDMMGWDGTRHRLYCRWSPGDLLVPRCTWAAPKEFDHLKPTKLPSGLTVWTHWDGDEKPTWCGKSRPGRFLPKTLWSVLPRLPVEDVRVERLQEITEADAKAEGVTPFPNDPEGDCWTDGTHLTAFEYLWGKINGFPGENEGGKDWKSNPWVWGVSFRRV